MARALSAIPLSADDDGVVVGVADPTPSIVQSLREVLGGRVTVKVATQSDITMAIGQSYRALSGVGSQVKAFQVRDSQYKDENRAEPIVMSKDAPVVQVVRLMITQGLRDRARPISTSNRKASRFACAIALTAPCTTFSTCPVPWGRPSSAGSRSWPA